jgi:hypothetical protein
MKKDSAWEAPMGELGFGSTCHILPVLSNLEAQAEHWRGELLQVQIGKASEVKGYWSMELQTPLET